MGDKTPNFLQPRIKLKSLEKPKTFFGNKYNFSPCNGKHQTEMSVGLQIRNELNNQTIKEDNIKHDKYCN